MNIIVKLGEAKRTSSPHCIPVVKGTLSNGLGLLEFPLSLHDGISEHQKSVKDRIRVYLHLRKGQGGEKKTDIL